VRVAGGTTRTLLDAVPHFDRQPLPVEAVA